MATMNTATNHPPLISEVAATRDYGMTVLRAARHRFCVSHETNIIELADELMKRADIKVIAVLDSTGKPLGILQKERLFSLLGKPFAREALGRAKASELAQRVPILDSHTSLFSSGFDERGPEDTPYRILVDGEGRFLAILTANDLSEYLSQITEDDIELAGTIQQRLEASNEPISGEGFQFEAWSRPAKGVGGDFWFSKQLENGSCFMALCDVSGKGVAASLVVALVSGMLRMYDFGKGLGSLLIALNEAMVETFHMEKYLTGFFCIFNPVSRMIDVADMGHSHALIFRDGSIRRLKTSAANLPIGVEPAIHPSMHRLRVAPGDALFVYSDGLTEQEDQSGNEFDQRRLASFVLRAMQHGESLRDALPVAIDRHRGRIPQQDDMSFMLLSILEASTTLLTKPEVARPWSL